MALLSEADKDAIWADYMEAVSKDQEDLSLVKNDLRDAFDTADGQLNTGLSSLPSELSDAQKSRLYRYVADRRFREGI